MKKKTLAVYVCMLILAAVVMLNGCGSKDNSKKETKTEDSQEKETKTYSDGTIAKTITVDANAETIEGESYKTITEAFAYANANPPASRDERLAILVAPGTYREYTTLTAPYVTLKAMDAPAGEVKLTFYYGSGNFYASSGEKIGTKTSASTTITETAHDFVAENITFENSYNIYVTEEEKTDSKRMNAVQPEDRAQNITYKKYQTQAVALSVSADRCIFRNCTFYGRQDTLYISDGRYYFKDCFIEGTVDYIFGDGVAVFESCKLNCPYNSGHVTASASDIKNPYGYLFMDCTITKEPIDGVEAPKDGDYSLGRPWKGLTQVIYWNCKMDSHIATGENRFISMTSDFPREESRFKECGTMDINGKALDLSSIAAPYEEILTEEDMEGTYSPYNHLIAKYNKDTQTLDEPDYWNPGDFKETKTK